MRVRQVLTATGLVAAGLCAQPVTAEDQPAEACLLVQDALDDTAVQQRSEAGGFRSQRDVDIVSADVATDGEFAYAEVRVQQLDSRPSARAAHGSTLYRVEFAAGSRRYYIEAPGGLSSPFAPPDGGWSEGRAGRVGGRPYPASGYQDPFDHVIRLSAPLAAFGRYGFSAGDTLTGFRVTATRTFADHGQLAPGVAGRVVVGDDATSEAAYVAGAPSCIAPDQEAPVAVPAGTPADTPVDAPPLAP